MATVSEAIEIAVQHLQEGRLAEAEEICRRVLSAEPGFADGWHLLGVIALQTGRHDVAAECIGRTVALHPDDAEAYNNLGTALKGQAKWDEAVACFRRAVEMRPAFAEAHYNLGNALEQQEQHSEAIACYRQALALNLDSADVHTNLGIGLRAQGRIDEAIDSYRRALDLAPDDAGAHYNLGAAFQEQEKLEDAAACYRRALELKPDYLEAQSNLGTALQYQGKLGEAAACFREALKLDPSSAQVHWNQSLLSLLAGDFERGWPEYEWRWKTGQLPRREFPQPKWTGEALAGKAMLIHAEQGFGDTIQFVRYASMVKSLGVTVFVECQRPLTKLLASCPGIDRLFGEGDELPAFDFHSPLLSLPGIFGTRLETIPANVPYLFAEAGLVAEWRERLESVCQDGQLTEVQVTHGMSDLLKVPPGRRDLRIGINWHGRAGRGTFRQRDIPLDCFAGLARIPGVRLISLQKGKGREELAAARNHRWAAAHRSPVDLGDDVDEAHGAFMDTAAIMMNLDLVITSDTAIPHLAGALGVPVWLALPFVPDWRWLLNRTDSPWYPTMRLFRQKKQGDWTGVFEEMQALAAELISRT
jgi:tetratricopeptide (TPR) repeat protein